jgi:hypothetical protein
MRSDAVLTEAEKAQMSDVVNRDNDPNLRLTVRGYLRAERFEPQLGNFPF